MYDHFKSIRDLHRNGFRPAHRSVELKKHGQLKLPFENPAYHYMNSHVMMGVFYELLTMGLFGGRLYDSVKSSAKDHYRGWIQPDVLNEEDSETIESKGCRIGHQLYLQEHQIKKYHMFQILYPEQKIYYAIWRHSFRGIMNCGLGAPELFSELSKVTRAGMLLPFSIIMRIYETDNKDKGVTYYDNRVFGNGAKVSSTLLNNFLFKPREIITDLGLEPDRFEMDRRLTPVDFRIEGNKVVGFPFIIIEDTLYSDWVYGIANEVPF